MKLSSAKAWCVCIKGSKIQSKLSLYNKTFIVISHSSFGAKFGTFNDKLSQYTLCEVYLPNIIPSYILRYRLPTYTGYIPTPTYTYIRMNQGAIGIR